ncbi:hypothetical protein MCEREM21A_01540 [Sphingomonadaceae bacterium]
MKKFTLLLFLKIFYFVFKLEGLMTKEFGAMKRLELRSFTLASPLLIGRRVGTNQWQATTLVM